MAKALIDLTDDELRDAIRREAENVQYSYSALVAELERRTTERHARVASAANVIVAIAAIVALALSTAAIFLPPL